MPIPYNETKKDAEAQLPYFNKKIRKKISEFKKTFTFAVIKNAARQMMMKVTNVNFWWWHLFSTPAS
jgi:hypothetical protein